MKEEKKRKSLEELVEEQREALESNRKLRSVFLWVLAEKYFSYLKWLAELRKDDLEAFRGVGEGKTKYLSNLFNSLKSKFGVKTEELVPRSKEVLRAESEGRKIPVVFEHAVPKQKYVQGVAEERAFSGNPFSVEELWKLLLERWRVCEIAKEEDKKLGGKLKTEMGWEKDEELEKDWWKRYRIAGIEIPGWFEPEGEKV